MDKEITDLVTSGASAQQRCDFRNAPYDKASSNRHEKEDRLKTGLPPRRRHTPVLVA